MYSTTILVTNTAVVGEKKTKKKNANERRQNKAKHPAFPLNCVVLATKNFYFHISKIFLDIVPAIYRIPDKGCCSMKMNFSTIMFHSISVKTFPVSTIYK